MGFRRKKPGKKSRQEDFLPGKVREPARRRQKRTGDLTPESHFPKPSPSIVLVHGAFADGTGWQKVIPLLEKDGFTVTAVQNPLKSVADDVATTRRVIIQAAVVTTAS